MKRNGRTPAPDWPSLFAELAQTARDPRLARFYQAGTVSADTPLDQAPLLALDVETTGLDPISGLLIVLPTMFMAGYALQRGLLNFTLEGGLLPPLLVTSGLA